MTWRNVLWFSVVLAVCGNGGDVRAYDSGPAGGSISDPCVTVTFTDFVPTPYSYDKNNVEVPPQSPFSFFASKATKPNSIAVTVKDEKVPITVKSQSNGYLVTGKLPAIAMGSFVRVEITAKGPSECTRADGWLLKVGK